jgi:hypothetical protein
MLLPKIDRALDVAPLIRTLLVYLSRYVLGVSSLLSFQHHHAPKLRCLSDARYMSFVHVGCFGIMALIRDRLDG